MQMVDKWLNGQNASKGDTGVIIQETWTQSLPIRSLPSPAGTPTLPCYLPYTSNSHSILSAIQKPLEQNSAWLIEMVKCVS